MKIAWNKVTTFSQIVAIILFVGVFALGFCLGRQYEKANESVSADVVEAYVTAHISELSPEKEVLGGTFYVTNVMVEDGTGTVWYEDGHIALIADFTYRTDTYGAPLITSFTVRE